MEHAVKSKILPNQLESHLIVFVQLCTVLGAIYPSLYNFVPPDLK